MAAQPVSWSDLRPPPYRLHQLIKLNACDCLDAALMHESELDLPGLRQFPEDFFAQDPELQFAATGRPGDLDAASSE